MAAVFVRPDPIGIVALLSAAVAAVILIVYLVRRPPSNLRTKLWLLLGLGVLPGIAGASSTVTGMAATTHRPFCGSCHVMTAHFQDTLDPKSQSLAARHSRNPFFGGKSCYICHADYGMYGYAMTKAAGLRHVYEYYLGGYRAMSLEKAKKTIRLIKPYDNTNCRQCHTTTIQDWRRVPDHEALKPELDSNRVSCASAGCHGYAHPFTKEATNVQPASSAKPQLSVPAPSASKAVSP